MKVQTKITNNGKAPYTFSGLRGKRTSIKGGETVTFPYDLFSVVSRMDAKEIEKAAVKGILDVQTEVVTDKNILTITPNGNVNIGIEVPEIPASAPHPRALPKRQKAERPDMNASGVVVAKRSAAMESLGASTKSNLDGKIKDVIVKNGKAEEMPSQETHSIGAPAPASNIAVEAHNVFAGKEEISEIDKINAWLQEKDYNAVFDWLKENYPEEFAQTTKAAVRKCKTFEDLRTLLDI